MAAGGFSNLKNSAANTRWLFTDLDVESAKVEVARKAAPYFGNLQQNPVSANGDLRPNPLKLLFHYERTIRPLQDPEAARKSENAMNVLGMAMPKLKDGGDFQQFEQEIQRYQIPLVPFFMVSKFSNANGDVDEGNLRNFIWEEQNNQYSPSHYKEHAARIGRGESIDKTDYVDQTQTFKMSEINTATRSMLEYAVNDRVSPKNGYTLRIETLNQTVDNLLKKRLADNKIDSRNPDHRKNFKRYLRHYVMMMGRIGMWWNEQYPQLPVRMPEGAERVIPTAPGRLTGFELRLLLQHMTPLGPTPKTPPDEFKAPINTVFLANGWDSSNGDPGTNMLTLPPLRQLPRGNVVYDRGNGNMGWNHLVFNWKKGLGQIVEKWGAQCDTWLKALQGPGAEKSVQQSPEALDAMRNVTSLQSGNRTGAESLMDLLKKYPTWEEFEKNHVRKSLASEIRTVNKLYDNPIEFPGFRGGDLRPYVEQIKQIGATDPKAAHHMLMALSSQLVQSYKAKQIDWDTLTSLLHAVNVPVAKMMMRYPKMIDDPNLFVLPYKIELIENLMPLTYDGLL